MEANVVCDEHMMFDHAMGTDTNVITNLVTFSHIGPVAGLEIVSDDVAGVYDRMRAKLRMATNAGGHFTSCVTSCGLTNNAIGVDLRISRKLYVRIGYVIGSHVVDAYIYAITTNKHTRTFWFNFLQSSSWTGSMNISGSVSQDMFIWINWLNLLLTISIGGSFLKQYAKLDSCYTIQYIK